MGPLGCLLDPRLSRESHMFSNNDLVGTVEKTLSILGLENSKPEISTIPKKKVKLSITEYRQRKKLTSSDKNEDHEPEPTSTEENNSSESFKVVSRPRSGSTSSSTSLTSSDDEIVSPDIITAKVPAFNSEPTELERQREISSLRLKKAFGLAVDEESRPEAILNLELEPKVKPIPIPSPTFPIPGTTCEIIRDAPTSAPTPICPPLSPELLDAPPIVPCTRSPSPPVEEEIKNVSTAEDTPMEEIHPSDEVKTDDMQPNIFYTPDEEEEVPPQPTYEETSSINYVPPFNNPVYPNTSFPAYTSTIVSAIRNTTV
ncbi:hypothetical protein NQ318_007997 [Aromia moschata]|uniref:Uncharacterized protein n=1 Tax=Aromia moschata TaxID=1265417 RepID=A0AAV8XJV3_9CUCU|nr:hypothetical protein NQ318_007997 [Aromia moschata]